MGEGYGESRETQIYHAPLVTMEALTEKKTDLLTEEQAAERLLISRRRLQALCREGRIEFVQVTPRVRGFTEEHIAEYIRRKTITPPKVVDTPRSERLPFRPKSVQSEGGEGRSSTGHSVRAHLREEMRSWR